MKIVVVTGGAGFVGRALVRRLLANNLDVHVRVFSRDEGKHYQMSQEFPDQPRIEYVLGDVRDPSATERVLDMADTVYHLAAMKHVRWCEEHPSEAIRTNVLGTHNVMAAARLAGVRRVVLASSDKAVNPASVLGSTKQAAEVITRWHRRHVVRFCNVFGSTGSVGPRWMHQIAAGESLTVTDQRMTRYLMTASQAVDLLVGAADQNSPGIYYDHSVPRVNIVDLARAMLHMFQSTCALHVEGRLRAGEKLHEELATLEEATRCVVIGEHMTMVCDSEVHQHGQPQQEIPVADMSTITKFLEESANA